MCGIIAYFGNEKTENMNEKRELFLKLSKLIRHRGPDWNGIYEDYKNKVFIGHERLSIVSPESGSQPIISDDNLQVLCPNCHAQTHNFRGRNLKYSPPKFLDKNEVFDSRIKDFTFSNLVKEHYEMDGPPNGYVRKRHYFNDKYKISNSMMAKLIFVHKKNPMLIDMIDNNKDLTLTMVYKMIKQ